MPGDFGNLAGGGALALLLIREVFSYLGKQKKEEKRESSGDLDPAEWEQRIRKIVCEETNKVISEIKDSRRLNYNIRDIVKDIARKMNIPVTFSGD